MYISCVYHVFIMCISCVYTFVITDKSQRKNCGKSLCFSDLIFNFAIENSICMKNKIIYSLLSVAVIASFVSCSKDEDSRYGIYGKYVASQIRTSEYWIIKDETPYPITYNVLNLRPSFTDETSGKAYRTKTFSNKILVNPSPSAEPWDFDYLANHEFDIKYYDDNTKSPDAEYLDSHSIYGKFGYTYTGVTRLGMNGLVEEMTMLGQVPGDTIHTTFEYNGEGRMIHSVQNLMYADMYYGYGPITYDTYYEWENGNLKSISYLGYTIELKYAQNDAKDRVGLFRFICKDYLQHMARIVIGTNFDIPIFPEMDHELFCEDKYGLLSSDLLTDFTIKVNANNMTFHLDYTFSNDGKIEKVKVNKFEYGVSGYMEYWLVY